MVYSFIIKRVFFLLMILFYSALSFAGIETENVRSVKFNKMYFVYKKFSGSLSYNFKKELGELEAEFSSLGFDLTRPSIMFVGIKPYNYKKYDFFVNNTSNVKNDENSNAVGDSAKKYYLKNIDPVYYSTPVVAYVGFLVGGGDINESTLTSSGYNFFELSGNYKLFQIDSLLYKKNLENASINGSISNKDVNLDVSDMQIRDRVHMLNAMGKIKKDYIGMLEVYDSENNIYSFIGYYDNKLEEEERLRNEAILEDKANTSASEKFDE